MQALQSLRFSGKATASGGRVARVTLELKRPHLYRLEFRSQGTTSVFAHDGEIAWQVAPLEDRDDLIARRSVIGRVVSDLISAAAAVGELNVERTAGFKWEFGTYWHCAEPENRDGQCQSS